jgi:hypothetical protein
MIPHDDHLLPLSCPWCGAAFTYSWWHGGQQCKQCGRPTGKAAFNQGNVAVSFHDLHPSIPGTFDIGPAKDGFVPQLHHVGWYFRCSVSTGQLLAFLKRCSALGDYVPMTVTSMDFHRAGQAITRWHWSASVKIPLGKKPFEMAGVEWNNEMTVRPQ